MVRNRERRKSGTFFIVSTIVALIAFSFLNQYADADLSLWSSGSSYPSNVYLNSCVDYSSSIYCIGGNDGGNYLDSVYFAAMNSTGVGPWIKTTNYPSAVGYPTCLANSGYVYCIGGDNLRGYFDYVYFARLNSSEARTEHSAMLSILRP